MAAGFLRDSVPPVFFAGVITGESRMVSAKVKTAFLSVMSNTTLIGLKLVAGVLSGSVAIISEAIHSSMDLVAAIIAFFSVRVSDKPADRDHPYGHGKIESVSGVIEGLLIFVAAAWIIFEAIRKIINPHEIGETWLGIGVMAFSAVVNALVSTALYRTAKKTDSLALEADALHLKTDVYTSAGVAIGLVLLQVTGLQILDSIIAILVALLIIMESAQLVRRAFRPLLDTRLTEDEEKMIREIVAKYRTDFHGYHRLRTRKSGSARFVDFHLTVAGEMTVRESHALADRIEKEIMAKLPHTNVTIHVEPSRHTETNAP
jgi:cation diffusion facilitator family transporter